MYFQIDPPPPPLDMEINQSNSIETSEIRHDSFPWFAGGVGFVSITILSRSNLVSVYTWCNEHAKHYWDLRVTYWEIWLIFKCRHPSFITTWHVFVRDIDIYVYRCPCISLDIVYKQDVYMYLVVEPALSAAVDLKYNHAYSLRWRIITTVN